MLKVTHIILALSIIDAFPLYSQWENISIATNNPFSAVSFISDSVGMVAGGREIYKTANAGMQWELSFQGDTLVYFDEILMLNDTSALALGYDFDTYESVVARSSDNGDSWTLIDNELKTFLTAAYFHDDTIGFAVGHNNKVFRTKDAGLSWEQMSSNVEASTFFESIYFSNDLNGYVAGGLPNRSNYARSTDGGLNWEEIIVDSDSYLQSVFFIDTLRGYMVGWFGEILMTEDGGDTWTHQTSVNMEGNLEILFTNDSTGYIVGGMANETSIQKTTDNGMNWYENGPEHDKGLLAMDFPSEFTGYAVGAVGTVLKTINGGVTSIINNNEDFLKVYPNPATDDLNLHSNNVITEIRFFDSSGRELGRKSVFTHEHQFDLRSYPSGCYYVAVKAGKMSTVRKIVKL